MQALGETTFSVQSLGDGGCLPAGIFDALMMGNIPVVFSHTSRDRLSVYYTAEEFASMTLYVPEWQIMHDPVKDSGCKHNCSLWANHERTCLENEAKSETNVATYGLPRHTDARGDAAQAAKRGMSPFLLKHTRVYDLPSSTESDDKTSYRLFSDSVCDASDPALKKLSKFYPDCHGSVRSLEDILRAVPEEEILEKQKNI